MCGFPCECRRSPEDQNGAWCAWLLHHCRRELWVQQVQETGKLKAKKNYCLLLYSLGASCESIASPSSRTVTTSSSRDLTISIQHSCPKKVRLWKDNLEEVRKSLEHQKAAGKRLKFCWIFGCTEGAMNRRVHTMTRHVPMIQDNLLVQAMRLRALRQVSTWLHGRPASLDELLELVNAQRIIVPQAIEQGDEYHNKMMKFCHHAKLPAPECFTLNPLNSAGALIHWRILAILSGMLQEEDGKFWISRFPVPDIICNWCWYSTGGRNPGRDLSWYPVYCHLCDHNPTIWLD